MRHLFYNSIFFLIVVLLTACSSSERNTFKVGIIPSQTEGELSEAVKLLERELATGLNRKVEIEVYPAYAGVVEAINYGKIDLAYFGPFTYVVANHQSGAEAIVTQLIDGKPFYHSFLITSAQSELNSLEDLLKKAPEITLAFGSINSTSGYIVPSTALLEQGAFRSDNDHNFKSIQFAGSHDIVALLVKNETVDVGAIDGALLKTFFESGKISHDEVKTIWQSDPIYQYPWAVRGDMEIRLKEDVQKAFLAITEPQILRAFGGANGFTEASDSDYDGIRSIAIKRDLLK